MKNLNWFIVSALLVTASIVFCIPIWWIGLLFFLGAILNLAPRWILNFDETEPISDTHVWVCIGGLCFGALILPFVFLFHRPFGDWLISSLAFLLAYFWTWQEPEWEIGQLDAKIAATVVMQLASLQMWWIQLKLRIGMWIINQ